MDPKVVQNHSKGHAKTGPQKDHQESDIFIAFSHRWTFEKPLKTKGKHRFFMFQRFHFCSLGSLTNAPKRHPKWRPKSLKTHSKGGPKCDTKKAGKVRKMSSFWPSPKKVFGSFSLLFPPPAPPWTPLFRGWVPGPLQGPILGWFSLRK